MASIFRIQQEYLELMDEIEETGELTQEQEEKLAINIENFEVKMNDYTNVVKQLNGDCTMIDDEIQRLNDLKIIKQNLIIRLKTSMRDALLLYGETGKTGNKILDLGTVKFYTKKNEVVIIPDEDRFMLKNDYVNSDVTLRIPKANLDDTLEHLEKRYGKIALNDIKYNNKIDKTTLKEDLKNKVDVDGASLVNNPSLIIK